MNLFDDHLRSPVTIVILNPVRPLVQRPVLHLQILNLGILWTEAMPLHRTWERARSAPPLILGETVVNVTGDKQRMLGEVAA